VKLIFTFAEEALIVKMLREAVLIKQTLQKALKNLNINNI
jgi:hypothetical protein